MDLEWLKEAYRRTRKDGAPGIDGTTAEAYAEHLDNHRVQILSNDVKPSEDRIKY